MDRQNTSLTGIQEFRLAVCCAVAAALGCSQLPPRVPAPKVNPQAAADQVLKLYDTDGDSKLSKSELAKCPGILTNFALYDQNGDGFVDHDEIVERLTSLYRTSVGLTELKSWVTYRGKPLPDAKVVFEPEPYLGSDVLQAEGTTDAHGAVQLTIPAEYLPDRLRTKKLLRCGTYKVRITHPTIQLPAKYNSDTTLGYETMLGSPFVSYTLTSQ